jgi:hypothetical protein
MGKQSYEPFRLRIYDGCELFGDPGELAGVGHDHTQKPEILLVLVQLQDHPRDQAEHRLDIALRFDAWWKGVFELA